MLAGLLKAPSRLSPARDPKAAEERAQLVLAAMREQKHDRRQGADDRDERPPATRAPSYWTGSENYVADRIMDELPGLIGEVRSDIIVDTTVDLDPAEARRAVDPPADRRERREAQRQPGCAGLDRQFWRRARHGRRRRLCQQPVRPGVGSAPPARLGVQAVRLPRRRSKQGRTPDSVRNDAPIRIGKWTPENYNGKYFGKVTLATALAKSLNSVAAQLAMEVGPDAVVEAAHRMGIESKLQANTSIALGTSEVTPLELTAAYVPFANGGYRPDIHFVQRVTTAEGEVLYENTGERQSPRDQPRDRRHDERDDDADGRDRHGQQGGVRLAGRRQDRHQPEIARRLVHRLHRQPHHRRLVRQRRRQGRRRRSPAARCRSQAWHEFMVAAHEGVPVADAARHLGARPAAGATTPPPSVSGLPRSSRQRAEPSRRRRQPTAGRRDAGGEFRRRAEQPTASIRRPVPPAMSAAAGHEARDLHPGHHLDRQADSEPRRRLARPRKVDPHFAT